MISVRSACIKKTQVGWELKKRKAYTCTCICEENDDETDYCNLVQDLYFPHSILFVGYGSWKHQEIGDDSCVDKW